LGLNEIYKFNSGVVINDVRLCYFSEPRNLAVKGVRLLMMVLDYSVDILTMGTISVAILSPRIPPFFDISCANLVMTHKYWEILAKFAEN
jgi:hypothetical protein